MSMAVEVWWSSLLAADRDLLELLHPDEVERVHSLKRSADQGRSMVGAALLRTVVGEHLDVSAREVVIDRTCTECGQPHGKPRVLGPGKVLPHVSVSHSGVLVVVALAPVAVGVDVQRLADLCDQPGAGNERRSDGAEDWVRREATRKLGRDQDRPSVCMLRPPLDGYAAALATVDRSPTDAELVVRHWPTRVAWS